MCPKIEGAAQIEESALLHFENVFIAIAPRINACGRMGHQEEALKLLADNEMLIAYNGETFDFELIKEEIKILEQKRKQVVARLFSVQWIYNLYIKSKGRK